MQAELWWGKENSRREGVRFGLGPDSFFAWFGAGGEKHFGISLIVLYDVLVKSFQSRNLLS